MVVFMAVLAAICLWQVKVKPENGKHYMTDYMSVDKTNAIKGIFILIVFISHFNSYVRFTAGIDVAYYKVFSMIGQRMVTLFLFYSGYGVMESIKKKKMPYVHKIPVNRVLNVLFRFDIAIILFAITQIALGRHISLKAFLLALTTWTSIGNSNWYICVILVCYIFTFLAFEIFKDKKSYFASAALVAAMTIAVAVTFRLVSIKPQYWYDTIILYGCGVWYSLLRDKIEERLLKNNIYYILALIITVCGECITMIYKPNKFACHELSLVLFAAIIILVTMKISFNNKILRWCGKHLFGIYILQRIPMIIFSALKINTWNIYVFFILCIAVTIPLAWVFDKYIGKLWKLITVGRKTKAVAS